MNIDLQNEEVLITGASKGIGRAIYFQLLASNASLVSHSNRPIPEIEKEQFQSHLYADLASEVETIELFQKAIEMQPGLNNLILNAGIFEAKATDSAMENWLQTWNRTIQINLNSVGILTKLAIEHFKKIGGGRLIYISSRAANRGETEDYLAYAASKGGIASLAKSVARSFGKDNIKAFVVAPGFVKTAMAEQFMGESGEQKVIAELSLNQMTLPSDIAPLVTFMVSGLMDHATGTTVDVNAGSYMR